MTDERGMGVVCEYCGNTAYNGHELVEQINVCGSE